MSKAKARNFAFILYPESLPDEWQDKLETLGVPMEISPLHDQDLKASKTGETGFKKEHYHVIYANPNPVTADSIRVKIKRVLGDKTISHVEIVDNIEYMHKYLTHESKDAIKKHKHKYDAKDIVTLSNFDIDRYIVLDDIQKKELFDELMKIIIQEELPNIVDLNNYIIQHGNEIGIPDISTLNDVVAPRTSLLRVYFDGVYQYRNMKNIDRNTGEIFH